MSLKFSQALFQFEVLRQNLTSLLKLFSCYMLIIEIETKIIKNEWTDERHFYLVNHFQVISSYS